MESQPGPRPGGRAKSPRSARRGTLARKYSIFSGLLLTWVAFVFLAYDLRLENLNLTKALMLAVIVMLVAAALARFTGYLLARPLYMLERGIVAVREGRLEPVQVSRTGDEIESLGDSLNAMIQALAGSRKEVEEHRELLEQRIRQRTEALEEATQRALSASRAKSEFLANTSHELRTPMNGILGMIDIVLDEDLPSEHREHLETAKGCANTLLALLNDILDLSKIEAGKMLIEKIGFDVRRVADDCIKSLLPRCRQKGITIRGRVAGNLPREILGDPLRVRQVLTNLLSNAVKFTESGWVELRIEVRDGGPAPSSMMLAIEVEDSGTGIPQEKLTAIFEEFTQADGSVSRKYGGTGLGLAITRRLVELHGGSISVHSEVGKGSCFSVLVPLEITVPAHAAPVEPTGGLAHAAPAGEPRARVLVAEDNQVNQKVVTALLGKHGYSVVLANNGREALDRLREREFDVILMDIQMPELDGIQATHQIRSDARWKCLPIIAMTAHAMTGDREKCLEAGMDGYLSKPVNARHLLEVLRQFTASGVRPMSKPRDEEADRPSPIDGKMVTRLMDNDARLISGMALLFLQLAPERLQRLQSAAIRRETVALRSQAQKLEKAAERIAAMEVAQCARTLAELASSDDQAAIQDQLASLDQEIRRLEQHVREPQLVPVGAAAGKYP